MDTTTPQYDWPARLADKIERAHPSGELTLASGISPSGPIHLGNLREVLTTHFVADELRRRGRQVRHLHSWDDYDRFRRVPAGTDPSWEQYVGMPLTSVPAPPGSDASSWGDHYRRDFQQALAVLGVELEEVSQTERYTSGAYTEQIVQALDQRETLGALLAAHQTKGERLDPETYFPYRPYCQACGKDDARMFAWNSDQRTISYACSCGARRENVPLASAPGKLVWKIDWPMRWAYEQVVFEPGGVDHMTPGSSWSVGEQVAPLFGGQRPLGQTYSFVGIEGAAKMSSSTGSALTPNMVLPVLSPSMLRWMYVRHRPEQSFVIDVLGATPRLYDEWDRLGVQVAQGKAREADLRFYRRAVSTAAGELPEEARGVEQVKFSAWVSFADLTLCEPEEMTRLASEGAGNLHVSEERAERARAFVEGFVPLAERTKVQETFDQVYFASLPLPQRQALELLVAELPQHWESLEELTRWCFGAPKVLLGYDVNARSLPEDAKAFQREYFQHVYHLLVGAPQGPRLPSLLRVLGLQRSLALLGAQQGAEVILP